MSQLTTKRIFRAIRARARVTAKKTVPSHIAERRARICAECPKVAIGKTALQKIALGVSGGDYVCTCCDCGINLLILTKEDLLERDPKAEYPAPCWMPEA